MSKPTFDFTYTCYTTRYTQLRVAWSETHDQQRKDRIRRLLDRQLALDWRHWQRSGQLDYAGEMDRRRRLRLSPISLAAYLASRK